MTRYFVLAAVNVLLFGCAESSDDSDGGARDTRVVEAGITPSPVCDRYLICFKAAKPAEYEEELKLFQPTGPCWRSEAARKNCEAVCQVGYDKLAQDNPYIAACGGTPPDGGLDTGPDLANRSPTGSSCSVDTDCQGGLCLDEIVDDGTTLTMTGGYCSRDCSQALCKMGEACFTSKDGSGKALSKSCLKTCVNQADCRTSEDYGCSELKVCVPDLPSP
jgi:hypothetical protein